MNMEAQMVKESSCNAGDAGSIPGSGRSPGGGKWQPAPVFSLPGEVHGQRSLVGCRAIVCGIPTPTDTIEWLTFTMYKELMKITRWGLVRKAYLFLDLVPEASSLLNPRMQGFTCVVMRQKWRKGQSCQQKPWDSSPSSVTEKADPAEEPTKPNQTKFSS